MTSTTTERTWDSDALAAVLGIPCGRPPAGSCTATFSYEGYVRDGLIAVTGDEAVAEGWTYALGVWQCPAHSGVPPWAPKWDGVSRLGEATGTWLDDFDGPEAAERARAREEDPAGTGWPETEPAAEPAADDTLADAMADACADAIADAAASEPAPAVTPAIGAADEETGVLTAIMPAVEGETP